MPDDDSRRQGGHLQVEAGDGVEPAILGLGNPLGLPVRSSPLRQVAPTALNPRRNAADDQIVHWLSLIAVVILSWLGIALAVGTLVGHGIAFGTGSDRRD